MLGDIALMVFAFGVPLALSIAFRDNLDASTSTGKFVRSVAVLSILVAGVCLYDCYEQGKEANRQLAAAQQQLQQIQGR